MYVSFFLSLPLSRPRVRPIYSKIKRSYRYSMNWFFGHLYQQSGRDQNVRKKREHRNNKSAPISNSCFQSIPSWSSCLFLLVFYFDELQHMTDWPINRYTGINVPETLDTFKLFDSNKSIYVNSGTKKASQRQGVVFVLNGSVSLSVRFSLFQCE